MSETMIDSTLTNEMSLYNKRAKQFIGSDD